ncbi:hypothetical protein ANCCAN_28547 [Ancylostoma caninum]|uniref:Phosphoglycerate mutase family protein n=1 Tax=Ancylostoma caninum TaxID=29170 RepID=A0A368F268_ANCCA|nr:hypothetical protein ANCCAN_28547 [Ancylostoma caninum]
MQISDLGRTRETVEDYNTRIKNTLMRIAKLHEVSSVKKDQIVLIVGHASTVDLAGGILARSRRSTEADFFENTKKIPYGSLLVLERVQGRRGWTPNLYAVPKVTYGDQTTEFDSAFVLREPPKVKN